MPFICDIKCDTYHMVHGSTNHHDYTCCISSYLERWLKKTSLMAAAKSCADTYLRSSWCHICCWCTDFFRGFLGIISHRHISIDTYAVCKKQDRLPYNCRFDWYIVLSLRYIFLCTFTLRFKAYKGKLHRIASFTSYRYGQVLRSKGVEGNRFSGARS